MIYTPRQKYLQILHNGCSIAIIALKVIQSLPLTPEKIDANISAVDGLIKHFQEVRRSLIFFKNISTPKLPPPPPKE